MSHLLLDTHVWAWSIWQDQRLTLKAVEAIRTADSVAISTISIYEIGQKVRLGKWPQMTPVFSQLEQIALHQGAVFAPVTFEISEQAAILGWPHRDPFDRLIAATALTTSRILISADAEFDALMGEQRWPGRLW